MPGNGKYGNYTYDMVKGNTVTDTELFKTIFHHEDSLLSHEELIAVAAALLTPSVAANSAAPISGLPNTQPVAGPMCDPQMFPEGVSLDYSGAPSYHAVKDIIGPKKGAEGWPTTPYTPPLASPGQGNGADPSKIPTTEITETVIHEWYVPGSEMTEGTVMPATSAPQVSSTKLSATEDTLVKGEHPKQKTP